MLATLTSLAQVSERIILKDTLVSADTANMAFNSIGSHLKAVQVAAYKISGTVAGSVYMQGTVDGINWVSVTDTLTLTNVATSTKTWTFTATYYNSYRARFISSTGTAAVTAALIRRADE